MEQAPSQPSLEGEGSKLQQLPQLQKLLQDSRSGGYVGMGSSPVGASSTHHHTHRHHHHRRRQLAQQRMVAATTAQRLEADSRWASIIAVSDLLSIHDNSCTVL